MGPGFESQRDHKKKPSNWKAFVFYIKPLLYICFMPFTYVLFSKKINKFYIGASSDLNRRLTEHNSGKSKFTSLGMPWEIVYTEEFPTLIEAKKRELQIKKRKSRTYILSLIDGSASRS